MSYAALIERLDHQLARIDEELRLSREAYQRHAEMFDRRAEMYDQHAQMYDRHAVMYDEHTAFIREMTLRIHRGAQIIARRLDRLEERSERHGDAILRALEDHGSAIRANTAAILKALDRLDAK